MTTSQGSLVEEVILEEVTQIDADIVVVGAKEQARWRRLLRRLLQNAPNISTFLHDRTTEDTDIMVVDTAAETPAVEQVQFELYISLGKMRTYNHTTSRLGRNGWHGPISSAANDGRHRPGERAFRLNHPGHRDRIFDRDFSLDRAHSGLGIVTRIAEARDMQIHLETDSASSADLKSTRFHSPQSEVWMR